MQKCAKMANFKNSGLNYWETVEDRWVYTARRFTSIESSYQPCDICRGGVENCHFQYLRPVAYNNSLYYRTSRDRGHSVRGR